MSTSRTTHMASVESTMPHPRVASQLPWAAGIRYRLRRAVASLLTTLLGVVMAGRGKLTGASGFTHGSDARYLLVVVLQLHVLAQLACARSMPRMYLPRLLVFGPSAPDSFGRLSLIEALICSSTDRINIYPKRLRHLPSRYFFSNNVSFACHVLQLQFLSMHRTTTRMAP